MGSVDFVVDLHFKRFYVMELEKAEKASKIVKEMDKIRELLDKLNVFDNKLYIHSSKFQQQWFIPQEYKDDITNMFNLILKEKEEEIKEL